MREKLIAIRRDLHQYPELGFEELRTSRIVSDTLTRSGFEVRNGIAKTGVLGRLKGTRPGRRVLVRADMDALPIQEANDVPYCSQNNGVMHACGHDGHTAIGLVAAELLAAKRDDLAGEVIMMFQPAEEIAGGALPMIEAGMLEIFPADVALALHLWSPMPTGQVGVREGPVFAANDSIEIEFLGTGTHGAMPQLGVDTVLMAAKSIDALQSIISRECSPLESYVVSFGSVHGGTAFNIIPDTVKVQGTVRTYNQELREEMPRKFRRILDGVTGAMGGDYDLAYDHIYPVAVNAPTITETVRAAATEVVGQANVIRQEPSMGGEDMAYVLERVPGCYFFVGTGDPEAGSTFPHHNARFNIDEKALPIGLEVMLSAVERLLQPADDGVIRHTKNLSESREERTSNAAAS